MTSAVGPLRCPCGGCHLGVVATYTAPPPGEVRFRFTSNASYHRELLQCQACGHFVSRHSMGADGLYAREYVDATYGDEGLRRAFDRITALAPEQSDNAGRVARVLEFAAAHFATRRGVPSVLDVGAGLCVFLHRMKAAGWRGVALDPDPRAVAHARDVVGVEAVCASFMCADASERFDVVTFNKVLEHVEDPVAMLNRSTRHLNPGGFVYVELPDGELAFIAGPEREEFFVDHVHAFSLASLALLARRAGFNVAVSERLREPSGKFTLRAFLTPEGDHVED